jgi:hypothetical protein
MHLAESRTTVTKSEFITMMVARPSSSSSRLCIAKNHRTASSAFVNRPKGCSIVIDCSSFTHDGVDVMMAQKIVDWNLKRYPEGKLIAS